MMDFDSYDKETTDLALSAINFSKYVDRINDLSNISVKNSSSLEQIAAESILRIWKTIFRIYATVKNDQALQPENIINYIKSELTYSKACWGIPGFEKRIFMNYRRLKNFIMHIQLNDNDEERKNIIKQYIIRIIAIIFKYPGKTQDSWSNRMKKLLRIVIHSCDDKIVTARISKGKSMNLDESPMQVDIDSLISQLNNNKTSTERRFSREKLNFSIQALLKQVGTDKTVTNSELSKSLINSIYKDSTQYRYFSSIAPASPSYLDSIQIANKRSSILLENITSLDKLKSGHYEETGIERKSSRNRTGIEKRKINKAFRSKTKEFNPKDPISEEPENTKQENSEEEVSEEITVVSFENEEPEDDIISNELQELVILNDIEKESQSNLVFKKQNNRTSNIFGRKSIKK